MKKIKILMLILVSIIFILEVGVILVQRGALSYLVKEKVARELEKKLKCKVNIGRISLKDSEKTIFHRVKLIFSDSTTLSIKKAVFFYDFREILTKREEFSLGNLKRVEIISPVLTIPFVKTEKQKVALPKEISISFKGEAFLKDGLLKIVDQKGKAMSTFKRIEGGLDFGQLCPSFSLKGEFLPTTSMLLSGQIDPSPLEIKFDLRADMIGLEAISSYLKGVKAKGALAGLYLKGSLSKDDLNYRLRTALKKADLKMANLKEPFKEIEGTILVDKGKSGVRCQGSGISFSWQDTPFLSEGSLNLEGRRARLLLDNLSCGELELGRIEIEGDLDRKRETFSGHLVAKELKLPYLKEGKGVESDLTYRKGALELTALRIGEEIKGGLRIEGGPDELSPYSYKGLVSYKRKGSQILEMETSFNGRGKEIEVSSLKVVTDRGKIRAQGGITPLLNISGYFDNLYLGKDKIRSSFNLKGKLEGFPSDVHFLGSLDLKGLFLNEEEIGELFCILDGKRERIRVENFSLKKDRETNISFSSGLLKRKEDRYSLEFGNLKVFGLSLPSGSCLFSLEEKGVRLDELKTVLGKGGNITSKGFVSGEKTDISLSLDNLSLADIPYQIGLAGKVGGKLKLTGNRKKPDLEADLILKDGHLANLFFNRAHLRFSLKDDIFLVDDLFIVQEDGTIKLNRLSLDLKPGGKVKILGELSNFGTKKTKLSSGLEFEGLREKDSIKGTATLLDLSINDTLNFEKFLTGMEFKEDGHTLEFFPISGNGILAGKIDLSQKMFNLGLSLKQVDVGLLTKYAKFIKEAKGKADISLSLVGSFDNPSLNGRITLLNGEASLPFLEDRLTNLLLDAQIIDNQLLIHKLKAKAGKEEILITSKEGSTPARLDILAKSSGFIPVSLPDFLTGQAKLSFNFRGSLDHPRASGQIWLKETTFTYPVPSNSKSTLSVLSSFDWDVKLIADKNVRYYNDFVSIEIKEKGWFSLVYQAKALTLAGEMAAKRGRVEYLGTPFEVKKATFKLIEGNKNPYLSGTAETKVDETLILLVFDGFFFEAEPQLLAPESFPSLSQEEIVKLLRYGKDYSKGELDLLMKTGVAKMIGRGLTTSLVNPLERSLAKAFRADIQLKFPYVERVIERTISQDEQKEGATLLGEDSYKVSEFSLGKYVLEDLYLRYHGTLHSTEQEKLFHLGLTSEWELQYLIPTGEAIKYKYRQENGQEKEEHKIILEKEIKF